MASDRRRLNSLEDLLFEALCALTILGRLLLGLKRICQVYSQRIGKEYEC